MLRLLVVACRLAMVQPADVVKEQKFSLAGCKANDKLEFEFHVLDVCLYNGLKDHDANKSTDEVGVYSKRQLDGKKLMQHYFSDDKCKTDLAAGQKTMTTQLLMGTIGSCTPIPEKAASKMFFAKMTGKSYFLIHIYNKKGCAESDKVVTSAAYEDGDCENKKDGTSVKTILKYESQTAEKQSYSQKDCAGDALDDKNKSYTMKLGDGCIAHPEHDMYYVKGEVKDWNNMMAASTTNSSNNSSHRSSNAFDGKASWALPLACIAIGWTVAN